MKITIIREPNDDICTRISAGGDKKNIYIVYRGGIGQVEKILETIIMVIKKEKKALEKQKQGKYIYPKNIGNETI